MSFEDDPVDREWAPTKEEWDAMDDAIRSDLFKIEQADGVTTVRAASGGWCLMDISECNGQLRVESSSPLPGDLDHALALAKAYVTAFELAKDGER